jgi:hypothetical protein
VTRRVKSGAAVPAASISDIVHLIEYPAPYKGATDGTGRASHVHPDHGL